MATNDPQRMNELLARVRRGDQRALADLFCEHRPRLQRMLNFRMDRRLLGRVDADDVLQEAWLDCAGRIQHFPAAGDEIPDFLWFRKIVFQTLINTHRRHIGRLKRDARRENSLSHKFDSQATRASLVACLIGQFTTPSQDAIRDESVRQLEQALTEIRPLDQEVLALRHFEDMSNKEVAACLGIEEKAASIRYVRALGRLKDVFKQQGGAADE